MTLVVSLQTILLFFFFKYSGPSGETMQLHHRIYTIGQDYNHLYGNHSGTMSLSSSNSSLYTDYGGGGDYESHSAEDTPSRSLNRVVHNDHKRRVACAWGITGEQAWTPYVQSGMCVVSMEIFITMVMLWRLFHS